jgi:hypothetical protein
MKLVELSGYSTPTGGCAPCGMGMGAIEIIPPTIEGGESKPPSEVVPMRAAATMLVVGAVIVTTVAVSLWWIARKR